MDGPSIGKQNVRRHFRNQVNRVDSLSKLYRALNPYDLDLHGIVVAVMVDRNHYGASRGWQRKRPEEIQPGKAVMNTGKQVMSFGAPIGGHRRFARGLIEKHDSVLTLDAHSPLREQPVRKQSLL